MKFEEVLPALREGKKIRRTCWEEGSWIVESNKFYYRDEGGYKYPFRVSSINADDWEIVPESKKVADYLVHNGTYQVDLLGEGKLTYTPCWIKKVYEVGKQPEGAVLVPGSERKVVK